MRRWWPVLLLLAGCAAEERLVGLRPAASGNVDVLCWEPLRGKEDLVYDLRIVDVTLGRVVYRRDGMRGSVHQLQEPFPRRDNLRWTVRARYRRNGHPRCTAWTAPEGVDRDGDSGPYRQPGGVPFQNPSETPRSK